MVAPASRPGPDQDVGVGERHEQAAVGLLPGRLQVGLVGLGAEARRLGGQAVEARHLGAGGAEHGVLDGAGGVEAAARVHRGDDRGVDDRRARRRRLDQAEGADRLAVGGEDGGEAAAGRRRALAAASA